MYVSHIIYHTTTVGSGILFFVYWCRLLLLYSGVLYWCQSFSFRLVCVNLIKSKSTQVLLRLAVGAAVCTCCWCVGEGIIATTATDSMCDMICMIWYNNVPGIETNYVVYYNTSTYVRSTTIHPTGAPCDTYLALCHSHNTTFVVAANLFHILVRVYLGRVTPRSLQHLYCLLCTRWYSSSICCGSEQHVELLKIVVATVMSTQGPHTSTCIFLELK